MQVMWNGYLRLLHHLRILRLGDTMRTLIHYMIGLFLIVLPIALMIPAVIIVTHSATLHTGQQLALVLAMSMFSMAWYVFWFDKD